MTENLDIAAQGGLLWIDANTDPMARTLGPILDAAMSRAQDPQMIVASPLGVTLMTLGGLVTLREDREAASGTFIRIGSTRDLPLYCDIYLLPEMPIRIVGAGAAVEIEVVPPKEDE